MKTLTAERERRDTQATLEMAVREHRRVCDILAAHFPTFSCCEVERCVDEAFDYLYAEGCGRLVGLEAPFRGQWIKVAKQRALNECVRSRHRLRSRGPIAEDQLARAIAEQPGVLEELEARRDQYRAEELLASLTPKQRALAEALWGADVKERKRRHLRKQLGFSEDLWQWHMKQLKASVRRFLGDRESGALCARRREMVDEYISWAITTRAVATGLCDERSTDRERFRALWLHLESCDSCRAYARRLNRLEGAVEHALAPPLIFATLAWLRHLGALAKAKVIGATATLAPTRVKAASGGGGATGAALSTLGGKAAVCVTAALCAATGVIASGAVPVIAHRSAVSHRPPRRPAPARAAALSLAVSEPAVPVRQAAERPVPPQPQRPTHPRPGAAPPLVLRPLPSREASVASARLPEPERPLPKARLPEAETAPSARASEERSRGSGAGCSAPGDLGC